MAAYAYFILANQNDFTTTHTNISFTLDDNYVGKFEHIPADTEELQYNAPVYVNETLENTSHKLVITAVGPDWHPGIVKDCKHNNSLLLFDYLITRNLTN